ncbi:asparagine synthetase B family protein [Saccharopolyspora shandongensis]|uniref:asparagine synthetase B family protein n=1 Tax=Saccharopolyspora shandongensis TaxID=418495 RepID=UPI003404FEAC
MTTLALAAVPKPYNAVDAMLDAIDRDIKGRHVTQVGTVALGIGHAEPTSPSAEVFYLPGGARMAVDAPSWARRYLADRVCRFREREVITPAALVELFGSITGDGHCVAVLPGRGCAAYRGPMSPRPLFYACDERSTLVASQIRALRAARPTDVDADGLAPFLVPQLCDPRGTAWKAVHRLPPGHMLTTWNGTPDVQPVAQVEPLDTRGAGRAELVAEFRERFLAAVGWCSAPSTGILLSGGIDSSALACAHTAVTDRLGRAYVLDYEAPLTVCDERRFADDVIAACGLDAVRVPGNRLLPLVADYPLGDEPEPWAYSARNWAMLRRIAADNPAPTTVLAGEGGDELLLGQVFAVADRIARGDAEAAHREIATFADPDGTEKVVHRLLTGDYDNHGARVIRALRELPPWLGNDYIERTGIVDQLAAGYPRLSPPGHIATSYSRALVAEAGAAGRVQCGGWWPDMARRVGLTITYPFLDPDLAALVWSLPPELLRDQGQEKVVLREALAGRLPTSVARRRDKAEALALMRAGLIEGIDQLRAVASDSPLVDLGIVDPARLRTGIERYAAGELHLGPALWATVSVHQWLTHTTGGHRP